MSRSGFFGRRYQPLLRYEARKEQSQRQRATVAYLCSGGSCLRIPQEGIYGSTTSPCTDMQAWWRRLSAVICYSCPNPWKGNEVVQETNLAW